LVSGLLKWPLLRRRTLVVVCAIVIAPAAFALTSYERLTRGHIELYVLVSREIVQVFVNCQLVYPAYTGTTGGPASLDLGWLDREATVTVQVRGRIRPGYYEVTLARGSRSELLASAGRFGDPVQVPSGRVTFDRSFTAGGRLLGGIGCQDAPLRFAFAAAAARTPRQWSGHSNVAFELANALWPLMRCALALIGAGGLIAAALLGRVRGASSTHGALVGWLVAAAELVLALVTAIATHNFNTAFDVCTGIGACCLTGLGGWLLSGDIRQLRRESRAMRGDEPQTG
jgi:hypothetical protein